VSIPEFAVESPEEAFERESTVESFEFVVDSPELVEVSLEVSAAVSWILSGDADPEFTLPMSELESIVPLPESVSMLELKSTVSESPEVSIPDCVAEPPKPSAESIELAFELSEGVLELESAEETPGLAVDSPGLVEVSFVVSTVAPFPKSPPMIALESTVAELPDVSEPKFVIESSVGSLEFVVGSFKGLLDPESTEESPEVAVGS